MTTAESEPQNAVATPVMWDDLTRQNAAFLSDRMQTYTEMSSSAARRLSDGSYQRADLVSDVWSLWGLVVRDLGAGWARAVRTTVRAAEDIPVPMNPLRRASTTVRLRSAGTIRTASCTTLTPIASDSGGATAALPPADIEIAPNPILADGTRATISISAAVAAGTYRGQLILNDSAGVEVERVVVSIDVDDRIRRC